MIGDDKAEALAELVASGFLRHISVSIDGPQSFHDEIRGQKGAFDKTANNIRGLRKVFAARGLGLPLSINTTLTSGNLHLLSEIVDAAAELEVKLIGLNQVGRLDSTNARAFESIVIDHLSKGEQRLIVDFSRLNFISSSGLRVLLIAAKKLSATQGKLVLCDMHEAHP